MTATTTTVVHQSRAVGDLRNVNGMSDGSVEREPADRVVATPSISGQVGVANRVTFGILEIALEVTVGIVSRNLTSISLISD